MVDIRLQSSFNVLLTDISKHIVWTLCNKYQLDYMRSLILNISYKNISFIILSISLLQMVFAIRYIIFYYTF